MKLYTYKIGQGADEHIKKVAYSEEIRADGLGEAIDKAKAITNLRPASDREDLVCLFEGEGGDAVWSKTVAEVIG